jgi:alkaline phosphatase
VTDAAGFGALRDTSLRKLVGLFGTQDMMPAPTRAPALPAMTGKAIDILSRDPDGFFLLVEGSQPDWRGHNNQPISSVVAEMLDFDAAIGVALAYQRRVPDVLILVVSDHETGGMSIETVRDSVVLTNTANSLNEGVRNLARAMDLLIQQVADSVDSLAKQMQITSARMQNAARTAGTERLVVDYTTGGHTGQMVPLFASGPGAETFGGMIANYRVGQMLLEIVRRPVSPVRRRRE